MTPRGLLRLLYALVACPHSQTTEKVIDGQTWRECSCGHVEHVWKPTGVVQKFAGHAPEKAESIFAREQRQAAARRAKSKAVTAQRSAPAKIESLRRAK